jgi:hypothetical protein
MSFASSMASRLTSTNRKPLLQRRRIKIMAGKIPTKIIDLVKAKSGKISSIEIAIALGMDNREENLDRVY